MCSVFRVGGKHKNDGEAARVAPPLALVLSEWGVGKGEGVN